MCTVLCLVSEGYSLFVFYLSFHTIFFHLVSLPKLIFCVLNLNPNVFLSTICSVTRLNDSYALCSAEFKMDINQMQSSFSGQRQLFWVTSENISLDVAILSTIYLVSNKCVKKYETVGFYNSMLQQDLRVQRKGVSAGIGLVFTTSLTTQQSFCSRLTSVFHMHSVSVVSTAPFV